MKKSILAMMLSVCATITLTAQTTYNFSASNETYANLSNAVPLSGAGVWDDPEYVIPMGFDFQVGNTTFNTIYIVEWGVGGTVSSSSNPFGIVPVFVPIAQDIVSRFDLNGVSTSPITYKIEGAAGSRIAKLEWQNFGFFDDTTENDFMNMQLWLYEGSNAIEYRFGPSSINNPSQSFEGVPGPNVALFTLFDLDNFELEDTAYVLTEDPVNPTVVVYVPGDKLNDESINGVIPSGTVYRFEQGTLSVAENSVLKFNLYPNPVHEFFAVQSDAPIKRIVLHNLMGQKVKEFLYYSSEYVISDLNAGVYMVSVETEKGNFTKRLIKQ